jgi:hypothetical protein
MRPGAAAINHARQLGISRISLKIRAECKLGLCGILYLRHTRTFFLLCLKTKHKAALRFGRDFRYFCMTTRSYDAFADPPHFLPKARFMPVLPRQPIQSDILNNSLSLAVMGQLWLWLTPPLLPS